MTVEILSRLSPRMGESAFAVFSPWQSIRGGADSGSPRLLVPREQADRLGDQLLSPNFGEHHRWLTPAPRWGSSLRCIVGMMRIRVDSLSQPLTSKIVGIRRHGLSA